MPGPTITKAGSIPLKKVGHTIGKNQGNNVLAKQKGEGDPTPISYEKA